MSTHLIPAKGYLHSHTLCCGGRVGAFTIDNFFTEQEGTVTCPRMGQEVCPECRDGKHTNCTGFIFDDADEQVPCPCQCTVVF